MVAEGLDFLRNFLRAIRESMEVPKEMELVGGWIALDDTSERGTTWRERRKWEGNGVTLNGAEPDG